MRIKGHTVNPRWTAAQVKRILKTMKLTQREFAAMVNVSVRSVGNWKRAVAPPMLRTQRELDRIEKQLGLERKALKG